MFCTHCGQASAATADFCSHCGSAVPPEVRAAVGATPPDPPREAEPDVPDPEPTTARDRRGVIWGVLAAVVVLALGGVATTFVWREPATTAAAAVAVPVPAAQRFDAARLSASVLTLHCFNRAGEEIALASGFIIRADGLAVTNFHVVEDVASMKGTTGTGVPVRVTRIVHLDPVNDLATLQIESDTPGVTFTPLRPADARTVTPGLRVYTISAPEGLSNTVSDGLLSAVRAVEGVQLLQISAPISHGSSGGPVFNEQGEVVGVIRMQLTAGQQLNFAIPIDTVVRLMNEPAEMRAEGPSSGHDSTDVTALFQRGLEAYGAKEYEQSARLFEQYLEQRPDNVAALYNAGLSHAALQNSELAASYFRRFVRMAPPDDAALESARRYVAAFETGSSKADQ